MEPRKMTDEKFAQTDKEAHDKFVKNQRPKSPWIICHGFLGDGGIAVDISKTDESRPRFSLKIGKRSAEGHMLPFVPMYTDGLKVRSIMATVNDLLFQAETWISEQVAEARIAYDLEQAKRGKPEARQTGKTQREREKKANKGKE